LKPSLRTITAVAVAAAVAALPYVVAAAPQEGDRPFSRRLGALGGAVLETDGTPVPRVTVTLVGPAPRLTERRVDADDAGRFEFDELRHGDYRLAIELPGLQAPAAVSVVILPGERLETNVVLSLFAYEVALDVVARADDAPQIIDTDSTADRRELTNRELTRLPLPAEQTLDALPVFPGVVRGPGGLISIGGTLPTDSVFLFNGADLMDPFTGRYRLQLPLDAVESMALESGVSSADFGDRLGGVVDVTTAGAGSNWNTEIASPVPRPWIENGSLKGVRRFTPRIRFSGPLSPKMTMSQSFGFRFEREAVFDTPDDRGNHTIVQQWQSLTQFDWAPDSRNDLRFMLLGTPDNLSAAGLSGLTPREATSELDHGTVALVANHQHRFDDRSFFDTTAQFNRQNAQVRPRLTSGGGFDMFPDRNDGTAFNSQERSSLHWQLKTVYNRIFGTAEGSHLLKAGFELHQMNLDGEYSNSPVRIYDNDGVLRREIESFSVEQGRARQAGNKWEAALFIQDRWRPSPRFWVDVGLRASHDSAVSGVRLAPRFGAAWDLRGDGKTLLKGSFGIMHRRVYLAEQFWDLFPTRVETRWDANGKGTRVFLPSRRPEELESPRATVWSISATRRLSSRVTAHVAYTERRSYNQLVFDRVEHEPVALFPGIGTTSFEIPEDAGLFLTNAGRSSTRQLELTANIRVGQQDQLFVSYVASNAQGHLNDFSLVAADMPAPVLRNNERAAMGHDVPNRVVIWGTFHLPWQIIASPSIEWRNGFPWSSLDVYRDYADVANDRRFPDYFSPDLQITKGLRLLGIPVHVGVLVTNFIFRDNPRDVIATVDSSRFGEFLNKVPSRVRLRFLAAF
jgi:hypothetical protein